jgi:hypothetical protein
MCSGAELRMDTAGYELGRGDKGEFVSKSKEMLSFGVKGDFESRGQRRSL